MKELKDYTVTELKTEIASRQAPEMIAYAELNETFEDVSKNG